MKAILSAILWLSILNVTHSQEEVVRITLEDGKSDILQIDTKKIGKAYVIGTRENIIKLLISEKYVQHQMGKGIIYNFLLSDEMSGNSKKTWTRDELKADSNKILIVAEDTASFNSIYRRSIKPITNSDNNAFQLGEVNNLKIFVSNKSTDTTIFNSNDLVVKIALDKNNSDIFQVEGHLISQVAIYGTRENIIRFLINDKFIKHKMDAGSSYSFVSSIETTNLFNSISPKSNKLLIQIEDGNQFIDVYNTQNKNSPITNTNDVKAIKLESLNNLEIYALPKTK